MISPMAVHIDKAMSNLSVAVPQAQHIDEQIFPVIGVDEPSDLFFKFSEQHFQDEPDEMAIGAEANDIEIDLDARGYYYADGHGYNLSIPDRLRSGADAGAQLEIEENLKITEKILLRKERNAAALITTGNITQNATLSGTSQWDDYENSDPILEIDKRKETVQQSAGVLPNCIQMPRPVFRVLRNHPRVINRLNYFVKPPLNTAQLAEALDIENIILSESLYKTTARGEADNKSYVWPNNVLMFYRPPAIGLRTQALGATICWILRDEGGPDGVDLRESGRGGMIVKRWRAEGKDSTMLGIRFFYTQIFINAKCGFLWQTAING